MDLVFSYMVSYLKPAWLVRGPSEPRLMTLKGNLTFGDHILHRFRVRQASTRLMSHAYSIPSGHGNIAVEHIF